MIRKAPSFLKFWLCILVWLSVICGGQAAQLAYLDRIEKLSATLGAVAHLDPLCAEVTTPAGADPKTRRESKDWLKVFEAIISEPVLEEGQRRLLKSLYLEGYNSHAGIYVICTENAQKILSRMAQEGQQLTREVLENFRVETNPVR